jgi:hypothetical protein
MKVMSELSDGVGKAAAILQHVAENPPTPRYFVETGTNCAQTLTHVAAQNMFEHHFSMEVYHPAYLNCMRDTWYRRNITVLYAESGSHLPRLLDEIDNAPCLFWLDAHDPEPDDPSPLEAELMEIFRRPNNHHILIDDYRCFEVYTSWPRPEWIQEQAAAFGFRYEVANDIIRLTPGA